MPEPLRVGIVNCVATYVNLRIVMFMLVLVVHALMDHGSIVF